MRGDALGEVAGGDLSGGGFDGAQGEKGTAHEDAPGPASDEDNDDAGDGEVRGRGAQGVLQVRQGQGDRHVSGELAGVLLVDGDDEGAPSEAGLRRGDGDREGTEGRDGRGACVDQLGQVRLARGLEGVLGVEVAVFPVGAVDVDVVEGGDSALAVGGEGRGRSGDLHRVRGGHELVVDLRGEVALEEADHDRAGQG